MLVSVCIIVVASEYFQKISCGKDMEQGEKNRDRNND